MTASFIPGRAGAAPPSEALAAGRPPASSKEADSRQIKRLKGAKLKMRMPTPNHAKEAASWNFRFE
jgi:hypothetical protein